MRTTRELIVRNEIDDLQKVAEFVESLGEEFHLEMMMVMNMNLALEEIISNIMLYAYPEKMEEYISIRFIETNGAYVFTISDSGVEFDPLEMKTPDISLSAEERAIGGLGIFLVRQLMDEVVYDRIENKNVLTMKKNK